MKEYKATTIVYTKYNETKLIPSILILNEDNPRFSMATHYFLKNLLEQGVPVETLRHKSTAICSLIDFYESRTPKTPPEAKLFLDSYTKVRKSGDFLNWRKHSQSYVNKILHDVKEFALWVSLHSYSIKDNEDYKFAQVIKDSHDFLVNQKTSVLFHSNQNKRSRAKTFSSGSLRVVKSFPFEKIMDLVNEAKSPRDKIAFILMAFGGRRISEVLHLFVSDFKIVEDQLRVILAHPENSSYQWKKDKELKRGTRSEYLKNVFDRIPRNQLGNLSEFVGWRGLKFQKPEIGASEIYFLGAIEQYLLRLHLEYMNERKSYLHHPYYFINHKGDPLCYRSLISQFNTACKNIGLRIDGSSVGTNTYSLRHFYGYYCSNILKLDSLIIQNLMGYTAEMFSLKYTQNKEDIFKELEQMNINTKLIGVEG